MPEIQIHVRDYSTNAEVFRADVGLFFRINGDGEYSLKRGTTDTSGICRFMIPDKEIQKVEIFWAVRCSGYEECCDVNFDRTKKLPPKDVLAGEVAIVDVRLKSGVTISGRVVDASANPISGVKVGLVLSGPNWCGWPYSFALSEAAHWPPPCETDKSGEFEWLSFPVERATEREARWVLTLEHSEFVPALIQDVGKRVATGERVCRLDVCLQMGNRLVGRVISRNGSPIQKAKIKVSASPRPDQPVCIRFSKEVLTSESGEFSIHGLENCIHSIDVEAAGFAPCKIEADLATSNSSRVIPDIVLASGAVLEGTLKDENGVLKNASIHLHTEDKTTWRKGKSDDEGRFRFEGLPSHGIVVLTVPGKHERKIKIPSEFIEINILKSKPVSVNIVDADSGEYLKPPGNLFIFGPGFSSARTVEKAGTLTLENLPSGHYTLIANLSDRPAISIEVEFSDATESRFEIRVPTGTSRRGFVKDKTGNPLSGVEITAHGRILTDKRSTTSNDDGSFSLIGLNDRYLVVFNRQGFAVKAIGVDAHKSDLLSIELIQGATVVGQIRSTEGKPIADFLVKVAPKDAMIIPYNLPSTLTDSSGRYELKHVPEGEFALIAGKQTQVIDVSDGEDFKVDIQT